MMMRTLVCEKEDWHSNENYWNHAVVLADYLVFDY